MTTSIRLRESCCGPVDGRSETNGVFDSITDPWAEKYGYSSTEDFIENAQKKFSLVETGIMDQPNCRLLLLNVSVSMALNCELCRNT